MIAVTNSNHTHSNQNATVAHYVLDIGVGLPEVVYTSEGNAYLHLPGIIVAESNSGETRYLLSDGLGSVRHAVDETAVVVSYKEFDPYGNPLPTAYSLLPTPYGFTGEWWEDEAGLLYLRARWYLPETGAFLSRDAVESEPPYQYVRGNVVNLTDPSGTSPIDDLAKSLREKTEACYNDGDLQCVWNSYLLLALGGRAVGYQHAAYNLERFLFKQGDVEYGPYTAYTSWLYFHKSVLDKRDELEARVLAQMHAQVKLDKMKGQIQTAPLGVQPDPNTEKDLYYAMNRFTLSAKADYSVSQTADCHYGVLVKYEYHYFDPYDWHEGLAAGGAAGGVAGFKDEWTAALHDNGLAQEYEINGYWIDKKLYKYPENWLKLSTIPTPSSTSIPIR